VKAGSFGAWAHGECHRLSADVVQVCRTQGVGTLAIAPLEGQELPMAEVIEKLTYKCAEAGIGVTRIDPATASGERAVVRPTAKQGRNVRRARAALHVLTETIARERT
jgi:transposase